MIGTVLDQKYRIDRELGSGGMGSVYLATHLGTERPVAVKVIAPQFMEKPEFVERFRREARAAGRLRHPNVVNVTDFGFGETSKGKAAYLVMEYLDGCTLGEVLDEEKNLPVSWTLDILEQICSAVHEAHIQGIIHRDLKPDNIWLEPNQRGGYTVKVLDFGIAKLEEDSSVEQIISDQLVSFKGINSLVNKTEAADNLHTSEINLAANAATAAAIQNFDTAYLEKDTFIADKNTAIQPALADEVGTQLFDVPVESETDVDKTRIIPETDVITNKPSPVGLFNSNTVKDTSVGLTRVGAVLGTPLYMSPEQCRGEKLDARSDVYSLGVIAYQMLSGKTPFEGSFSEVMKAHKEDPAPPLNVREVRRKLARVIISALEKDPDNRPQSAEAFAAILRARSEGIFGILRRSGMIYTSKMRKFILLSTLFNLPTIAFSALLISTSLISNMVDSTPPFVSVIIPILGVIIFFVTMLSTFLLNGTISWNVIHSTAMPLRPIRLRDSLFEAYKKWKRFAGTGLLSIAINIVSAIVVGLGLAVLIFILTWGITGQIELSFGISIPIGILSGLIAFGIVNILLMLSVPVVMMEDAKPFQALKRSKELVQRSFLTAAAGFLIMVLVPFVIATIISASLHLSARGISPEDKPASVQEEVVSVPANEREFSIQVRDSKTVAVSSTSAGNKDNDKTLRKNLIEALSQIIFLPFQILITSFLGIISALLYLKTRQAGGEPLQDLLETFEKTGKPEKKWQERVRNRLVESGRMSGRTSRSESNS